MRKGASVSNTTGINTIRTSHYSGNLGTQVKRNKLLVFGLVNSEHIKRGNEGRPCEEHMTAGIGFQDRYQVTQYEKKYIVLLNRIQASQISMGAPRGVHGPAPLGLHIMLLGTASHRTHSKSVAVPPAMRLQMARKAFSTTGYVLTEEGWSAAASRTEKEA